MKLTVDDAKKHGLQGHNKVRLNGMTISGVIMSDEEKGCVEVPRPDWLVLGMDYCPTQMLYGKVSILIGDAV